MWYMGKRIQIKSKVNYLTGVREGLTHYNAGNYVQSTEEPPHENCHDKSMMITRVALPSRFCQHKNGQAQ
jgi:hypothetical protein